MAGGKGKGQLSVKRKYSEEKEGWLHDLHQRSPHLTARQVFEKAQNENKKGFTQSIINQLWSDKRKKTQGAPVEQSQDVLDREQDLNVECGHDGTTQHDHVGSSGWSRTETTISANSVTLGNDPKPSQYIAAQTIPRSEVVHQDATTRAGSGFRKSQWLTNKEVTMAMERLSTGVCEILPSRSFNSRRPVSLHGFPSTLGAVLNIDNVHLALVVIVYKADSPSSIYFYDSSPRSWSKRILEIVENFTTRAANVEFDRPEEHSCAKQSDAHWNVCGIHVIVNWLCYQLGMPPLSYIDVPWWTSVISPLYDRTRARPLVPQSDDDCIRISDELWILQPTLCGRLGKQALELRKNIRAALRGYIDHCSESKRLANGCIRLQRQHEALNDVLRKQSEKSDSYKLPFETVESLGEPTLITKAARKNASNVLEEIETAKVSIEHVTSELAILSEKLFSHKELMKRGMKEASLGLLGIEQVMKALAEIPGRRRQSPERWGPSRQYSNQLSKSNCKTLEYIANVLKTQKKIVCLAGAGISTSAGVPDFRSNKGLFKTLNQKYGVRGKDIFHKSVYDRKETVAVFHTMIRNFTKTIQNAGPTAFHRVLADLEQRQRLLRLYSQNIDGFDISFPGLSTRIPLPKLAPFPTTILVHGTARHMTCTCCHQIYNLDPDFFKDDCMTLCEDCEEEVCDSRRRQARIGCMRSCILLYDDKSCDDDAIGTVIQQDLAKVKVFLCAGTSLAVPGMKKLADDMCSRATISIWISREEPPAGTHWDVKYVGDCDDLAQFYFRDCSDVSI